MFLASVYPNRLSVRLSSPKSDVHSRWASNMVKEYEKSIAKVVSQEKSNSLSNLGKNKTSWNLSYQSKKKLFDSIHFLFKCSKPRTVTNGKQIIYNYSASFITLTLPVAQFTSDLSVKGALNQFLTQLRSKYQVNNYVWKAELQGNGSIHFHIIIDKFIHHKAVRYYWNQALEVLGYVTKYREIFHQMSLRDYAKYRNISISQAITAYQKGVSSNWQSPPTEQVKNVRNVSQLGGYLSKYLIKATSGQDGKLVDSDLVRINEFGRVWGRSQSLSKIEFISRYDWESLKEYLSFGLDSLKKCVYDYCTNYFLSANSSKLISDWFTLKMRELGYTYRYPFPEPVKFSFN